MIRATGTAFTAMQTNLKTLSKDELSAEGTTIRQQSNSNSANSLNNSNAINNNAITINDLSQSIDSDKTAIMFNDPISNSLVKINLSSENIDKLQKHFSSDNFYKEDDGSIRLNGDANSFVSGWFGDIAYKREFLSADANKDGKLSDSEYGNTRNGFDGAGKDILQFKNGSINILDSTESIEQAYVHVTEEDKKLGQVMYNDEYKADSIQAELNTTLRIDADFSATISLVESYQASTKNNGLSVDKIVSRHINEFYKGNHEALLPAKIILPEDITDLQNQARLKLLAANGNVGALSSEERSAISSEISSIKKQIISKEKSDITEIDKNSNTQISNSLKDNQTLNDSLQAANGNSNIDSTTQTDTNTNTTKQSDLSSVVSELKATLTESSSFVDERV